MWPLTVALGFVIAYFILKFAKIQTSSEYLPGRSYYKSGPKVSPSPLPVDNALVGVGLETRVKNPPTSVMDSGSPVSMVMMSPAPMEMSGATPPMTMSGAPAPMVMSGAPAPMVMSGATPPMMMDGAQAPSPMMAAGNAPVTMTPLPPSPVV